MLGYRDSGMPDSEANAQPEAFANAPLRRGGGPAGGDHPPRAAAGHRHLRRRPAGLSPPRPPAGARHHACPPSPQAADPDAYPEPGEPWQPSKLYYTMWSRARMLATHEKFLDLGLESPFTEELVQAALAGASASPRRCPRGGLRGRPRRGVAGPRHPGRPELAVLVRPAPRRVTRDPPVRRLRAGPQPGRHRLPRGRSVRRPALSQPSGGRCRRHGQPCRVSARRARSRASEPGVVEHDRHLRRRGAASPCRRPGTSSSGAHHPADPGSPRLSIRRTDPAPSTFATLKLQASVSCDDQHDLGARSSPSATVGVGLVLPQPADTRPSPSATSATKQARRMAVESGTGVPSFRGGRLGARARRRSARADRRGPRRLSGSPPTSCWPVAGTIRVWCSALPTGAGAASPSSCAVR